MTGRLRTVGTVILLLITVVPFGGRCQTDVPSTQFGTYDWDRLEGLVTDGFFATARQEAVQIWRQAQADNDGNACLKAAFYLTAIDYAYDKYPTDSAIMRYSFLAHTLQGADRAVAYAFLFQTYSRFYSDRYYRLNNNSPSDDPNLKYTLWSLQRMEDTLMACADSIVAYAELLRTTRPDAYRRLLNSDTLTLPPIDSTLLGILVQTLMEPYSNYAVRPFMAKMYQRVAGLYSDGPANATLWLELRRLDGIPSDSISVATFATFDSRYNNLDISDDMRAMLALRRAMALSEEKRKIDAEQLCLETERLYPGTYGAVVSCQLRREICMSEYSIRYSGTESSSRSRLAVVEARNTSLLHFKLIRNDSLPYHRNWPTDTLLGIAAVAEWDQTLPDPGDHLEHSYFVALPAVAQGDYYLVAYTDSGLCYDKFRSADAAYITYGVPGKPRRLTQLAPSSGYLVDRITGMPLKGRRMTLIGEGAITEHVYRRHCRTDKDGFFHFPVSSPRYIFVEQIGLWTNIDGYNFEYGNDNWRSIYSDHNFFYDLFDGSQCLDIVMTDRPVYRLGDTVHFCCVAYRQHVRGSNWRHVVRPTKNLKLTATFCREDSEDKDTLYLTTDRYGRCWGEFVVPPDGQNGEYELVINSKNYKYSRLHNIEVEAYRPPRFTVTMSTVDDGEDTVAVHRMGQPVTIYGKAMSYSGAPMTGSRVRWKVSREKLSNPLQYFSDAKDFAYSDSLMVDDDGSFRFSFTPQPDDSDTDRHTSYVYTAYASVIDADGEMHECNMSLRVSSTDGYCMLTSDDLSHLTFVYNNFDHQPLEGTVRVTIQQIRQPDTLRFLDPLMAEYSDARWIGSEADFRRLFPHLAFSSDEVNPRHWPVLGTYMDRTTTCRNIDIGYLPSGMYRISFLMPDGAHHDTVVNYVAKGGRVMGADIVWLRTTPKYEAFYFPRIICSVGDTLRIELGSPYDRQPVYYRFVHASKTLKKGMILLDSNKVSQILIPITDKMRNSCVLSISGVREGRMFTRSFEVYIVHPERHLDISTETVRDRLQPGQQEQWKLHVTRFDSTCAEANLCLTMYDKSLEQYKQFRYGFGPLNQSRGMLRTIMDSPKVMRGRFHSIAPAINFFNSGREPQLGFSLWSLSDWYKQLINRYGSGSLVGRVLDAKTGEMLIGVNIVLKFEGKIVSGTRTDFDGRFVIQSLPSGIYDMEISYIAYETARKKITIQSSGVNICNAYLSRSQVELHTVQIKAAEVQVIGVGAPERGARITSEDIARMPSNSVGEIVSAVAGVGYVRGENGMVTMQNGVRKRAGINVPKEAISEVPAVLDFDDIVSSSPLNLRQNFSTLAFFEPALRSGSDGSVSVNFTLPDALTQWQVTGFVWDDDYAMGTFNRIVYTQKELMVQPQLPRFLRQGDTIELRTKVSNLTDSIMVAQVTYNFSDTLHSFAKNNQNSIFTIVPHTSGISTMRLPVSSQWQLVDYKIFARNAGRVHLGDGEQGRLPVLSMNERVTTTRMLYIGGSRDGNEVLRTYSISLAARQKNDSISIGFTASPIDYAIEALPHFKRHFMPGNIYLANSIYIDYLKSFVSTGTEKDKIRAAERYKSDRRRLLQSQNREGGWSWMPGGSKANLYVTTAVMQRLAQCHLLTDNNYYRRYYSEAIEYLDQKLVDLYNMDSKGQPSIPHSYISILYTRGLYLPIKPFDKCDSLTQQAYRYYYQLCRMRSMEPELDLSSQGQIALLMLHMGDTADAVRLATRIKEKAHTNDSMGMYWIDNSAGLGWHQRPIENAALIVDVMADVLHDWDAVNRIQQWILSYRQGTTWRTDMATASAVGALLRQPDTVSAFSGGNVTGGTVSLTVNGIELSDGINPITVADTQMNIELRSTSRFPAWGALFYSHDTPVDSIRSEGTGITLRKTYSIVVHDGSLSFIGDSTVLHVGDRVRVHIDIYCERDLDNMVLRDQRASGFEPVSTASGWKWNEGLHYYVDMRDESSDCYIDRLNEGHYYVEYDLWVRHAGIFTGGISTLYSAYAPEFRAYAPSVKFRVSNQ